MAPSDEDLLCPGWLWDPVMREMRHYRRKGKGWEEEPDAIERLPKVKSVTWHRWSQAPMQSATGQTLPARQSRVVIAYDGGGDLTINENNRECAEKIAKTVAEAFGLAVVEAGAPGGRRTGTSPIADSMGRLVTRSGDREISLDPAAGEIIESKGRLPMGKSRRRIGTTEVRWLEFSRRVEGPMEKFTLAAVVGPQEERLPVAEHTGYEGWADPEEWLAFTAELGRRIGAEVREAEAEREKAPRRRLFRRA